MGNIITGAAFAELKAKVKAECSRRNVEAGGSVEQYAGTAYDYIVPATAGNIIKQEHFSKINIPISAINSNEINELDPNRTIAENEFTAMSAQIANLESKSKTATTLEDTGCNASCTGLCFTSCTGGCYSGCTGTCTGTCQGTCQGGCGNDCTGSCGGCDGTCYAVCMNACNNGCAIDGCTGQCKVECTSICTATCA